MDVLSDGCLARAAIRSSWLEGEQKRNIILKENRAEHFLKGIWISDLLLESIYGSENQI